jgi:hypothetical protein
MNDDDDDLKPGIDKPRHKQYLIGVACILLLALIAWCRLG